MKHAVTWLITVALLALAWGVTQFTPDDQVAASGFPVTAELGKPAHARDLIATIEAVQLTNELSSASGWSAQGTWVVVTISAQSVTGETATSLRDLSLLIGDRTYSATERVDTFATAPLDVGLSRTGMIAFEIADDLPDDIATLQIAPWDTALDAYVEFTFSLADLEQQPRIEVMPIDWTEL